MARVLGYGGLANTNGLRSFAGKVVTIITSQLTNIAIGRTKVLIDFAMDRLHIKTSNEDDL